MREVDVAVEVLGEIDVAVQVNGITVNVVDCPEPIIICYWSVAFSAPNFPTDLFDQWTINGVNIFNVLDGLAPEHGYYYTQGASIDSLEWIFVYMNLPQGDSPPVWEVRDHENNIVNSTWVNQACGETPTGCAIASVTLPDGSDNLNLLTIMGFNISGGGILVNPISDLAGAQSYIENAILQVFGLTAIATIVMTGALSFTVKIDGVPAFTEIGWLTGGTFTTTSCDAELPVEECIEVSGISGGEPDTVYTSFNISGGTP